MEWGDAYHRLVLPSPFSCKGETLTSSVHLGWLGSGRRKRGLGWAQRPADYLLGHVGQDIHVAESSVDTGR